jgi:hypothetical protein
MTIPKANEVDSERKGTGGNETLQLRDRVAIITGWLGWGRI